MSHRPSFTIESTTAALPMRNPLRAWGSRYGALVIDSMPPATTISELPVCTDCAASATARNPDPQTMLMVSALTSGGRPA